MADQEPPTPLASPIPPSEVKAPELEGPMIAELQARIAGLEAKYQKEVGDRDRGLLKQDKVLKETREELRASLDALARKTFGEEEPAEESEYQRWQKKHGVPSSPPITSTPALTEAHLIASGRMIETAEAFKVAFANPPSDVDSLVAEVNALYGDNPTGAAERWRTGLQKRADSLKAKAEETEKAKAEEAERKAKLGQRDTSPPTGGSQGTYQAIRDAWMKNPNDPANLNAYIEARRARGI